MNLQCITSLIGIGYTLKNFLETPLQLSWKNLATSMKHPWIFLKQPWNTLKISLMQSKNFLETVLKHHFKHPLNFLKISLKYLWNFFEASLKLFWNTLESPSKHSSYFFEIPLELELQSFLLTPFIISWNTLRGHPFNLLENLFKFPSNSI